MKLKVITGITLTLLLIDMLILTFDVQPIKATGTVYIRADGSVEGTDKIQRVGDVYAFTDNIYDEIVVEKDDIVVDGNGYTLQGTETGTGIDLSDRSNVTIENMEINGFSFGIYLSDSFNISISGNNITNNYYGIRVWSAMLLPLQDGPSFASNYIRFSGNNIANNYYGIWLWKSSSNSIFGNDITSNYYHGVYLSSSSNNNIYGNNVTNNECGLELSGSSNNSIVANKIINNNNGIRVRGSDNNIYGNNITNNEEGVWLSWSSNNFLSGNLMKGNEYNFYVGGQELRHFVNLIDISNLVDGRPVHYLVNKKNLMISPTTHPKVGYLALINCTNATVEGLTLKNNGQGLLLAYTNNSRITDNHVTNNKYGIILFGSNCNTLRDNCMVDNIGNFGVSGWNLSDYVNDVDSSNTVEGKPIYYWINKRDMTVPLDAGHVTLVNCTRITVKNLNLTKNTAGVALAYTTNSTITKNTITNNDVGIWLWKSSSNRISGNILTANNGHGIRLDGSSNNSISGNKVTVNNWDGISLAFRSMSNSITGNSVAGNNSEAEELDSSGIWDTPYVINAENQDNYPLMNPWTPKPPIGTSLDLVRRKAWPEHHHYLMSRDEDEYQTLYCLVENTGNVTIPAEWYKTVWNLTTSSGVTSYEIIGAVDLVPKEITTLTYNIPASELSIGKYHVEAKCYCYGMAGETTKTFTFKASKQLRPHNMHFGFAKKFLL